MQSWHSWRRRHPRLVGLIIFLIGAAFGAWVWHAMTSGGSLPGKIVVFAPLFMLYGLGIMIYPSVALEPGEFRLAPFHVKAFYVTILIVGGGLGAYLLTYFK